MAQMRLTMTGALLAAVGLLGGMAAGDATRPVDLGPQAQGDLNACFQKLEPGEKDVDGVAFRVTDARLRVEPKQTRRVEVPPAKCGSIHFLHYTEHTGAKLGEYTLVFEDGERAAIELFGGLNIQDWWIPGPLAFGSQAHADVLGPADGQRIGFWRLAVRNPRPEVPLTAVEVKNTHGQAVINVIAVSVGGACDDQIGGTPVWAPDMDEHERLSAMLAVSATAANKAWIFEQLRATATVDQIPVLAEALADEELSHAARIVLEPMPSPKAGVALREALGKTSGAAKMGIVESLGRRGEAESVRLVAPLLQDEDPAMASAAALALGRIGGPVAVEHLKSALDSGGKRAAKVVVLEGLLHCAEALQIEDQAAAYAQYSQILDASEQDHFRTAAYSGMILSAGDKAHELAVSALLEEDPALWAAAVPAVREIEGAKATQAFALAVPRVSRGALIGLLEALGQRGDRAAAPAVAAMLKDEAPAVRAVAIATLALIGDGSSVPALVDVAAHGAKPDRAGAARALARLNAPDTSAALLRLAQTAEPAQVAVAVEALGERRDSAALPVLYELTRHPDGTVRTAVASALGQVADPSATQVLCHCIADAQDEPERTAAARALVEMGRRHRAPDVFVENILANLSEAGGASRCALLRVCGEFRDPRMVQALGKAVGDSDPAVRDAAVRALAGTEAPGALAHLMPLAESEQDLTRRVLVLRGIARLASSSELEDSVREDALLRAIAVAERADEQKLLLGALGGCHTPGALECVEEHLSENEVVAEAAMAWALIAADVDVERAHAQAVLEKVRQADVAQEVQQAVVEVVRKATATPVPGDQVAFERIDIDAQFRSEGVAVADVNQDGRSDILAGDVCYLAPDWQVREVRPPQTYDPQQGYSQCFANFAKDVDQDGWMDSIIVGFPSGPAHWYRNPGEATGHWEQHPLAPSACGETPIFGDLLGDGRSLPVFAMNKRITWFKPQGDKNAEWQAFPVTQELPEFEKFGHGLGMGDVNRDGRIDLIGTGGWWEAPEDRGRRDWPFHKAALGPACADMVVYDVDDDGDSDVITSSAHEYGIWWFEQRAENGKVTFTQHEIDKSISQTHALILADMNCDGVTDLVTGKRYRAHNGHDPGSAEPAILCWLELQRPAPGEVKFVMREIDNDSGVGTQFEVCDLDGDGLLDVVTSNKKGVHAFVQRRSN